MKTPQDTWAGFDVFPLGEIRVSDQALTRFKIDEVLTCIERHHRLDCGLADGERNIYALQTERPVVSRYRFAFGRELQIVTSSDRSKTAALLSAEGL